MEANLEWPQVDLIQNDRLSFDRKRLIRRINRYALEFIRKRHKVAENLPGCLRRRDSASCRQLAADLLEALQAVLDGAI
jgi:hypothetical protein